MEPIEVATKLAALEAGQAAIRELMHTEFNHQAESIKLAVVSVKEATVKAETATEKRLDAMNGVRQMAIDQAATYARSSEVKLVMDAMEARIGVLSGIVHNQVAARGGMKELMGYIIGIGGVLFGVFHR